MRYTFFLHGGTILFSTNLRANCDINFDFFFIIIIIMIIKIIMVTFIIIIIITIITITIIIIIIIIWQRLKKGLIDHQNSFFSRFYALAQ